MAMAPASSLTAHVTREFTRRWGNPAESEIRSWKASLTALAGVIQASDVIQTGVGVELKLPFTDRRVDASFVARDEGGTPTVVLVELKQWNAAGPSLYPDNVVVMGQEMLHPGVQAAAYAQYLRDSHSAFSEDGFRLEACAYLHNMSARAGEGLYRDDLTDASAVYTADDSQQLATFLRSQLAGGDGLDLLPKVVEGRYKPSRTLIKGVAEVLRHHRSWTLLDEQRVAFNMVRGDVHSAMLSEAKSVVIIRGGPGTGKSVIAAHLLVEMAEEGFSAVHATGSKAFTTNLRAIAPNPRSAGSLFSYFNNFLPSKTEENAVDLIIADEAHRLRSTSNGRFTGAASRSDIPQAEELVRAARVSVFLLDERQQVRPGEIGSTEEIRKAADSQNAEVREIELTAQFRCNGCDGYIRWVDDLFSNTPKPVGPWAATGDYDLRAFDTVDEMEREIIRLARTGKSARLVAGFCWPWSDTQPDGTLVHDVAIDGWTRPWNEMPPEQRHPPRPAARPDRHPYTLWATDPARVREVGCIYSAQGFEFDYCGVVLGPDLVWRDGKGWVARRAESADPAVLRRKITSEDLTRLLQQTYRVLMTRGIVGTFVYSVDGETLEKIMSLSDR
jgi:Mrp family chromosome partitioning ATPase